MADDLPLGSKSEKLSGKKYSKLPRDVQDAFDEYEFAVEVITEAKPEEAVELYKRLQGGTPLNFGEKIFAYPGKMTEFIKRRLVNRKLLKTTVGLANTRYSHYAVCAQLCLLTIKGAKEDLKLKNLEKFFREYAEFNERSPEARKIYIVIKFLEKAFLGEKETALRNRPNIVSVFNLVSDISTRGNILGKEREIGKFFRKFTKDLQKEFEKDPDDRDPALISYQSAVTQGADKIKYVNLRHEILLKKLAASSKFFQKLIYPPSPEERFRFLYEQTRKKSKSANSNEFEIFLIETKGLSRFKCKNDRGKPETFVGHIRHCLHHVDHGKFNIRNLPRAMKILEDIA
ncbi:MAG: hypothetical protein A3B23_00485 [Candidatus Colwellbacteria bacterium RIFCSPLOWO2_01_FULL_48_10]|uniref:Uncharacterized protein n=1 Tax=Candidatus Colwellbacteria bacterium RIFCSPLOWO2_01_FULL_48_10 TaxID=1797690 RepID=A0A1G1Z3P0_9BACT|nr:MAG: hypothetical protein A3B23_00485 [Candidatus Colwellbacteria bacterium RIFCSPLOWO2_01_FULL_48_10]